MAKKFGANKILVPKKKMEYKKLYCEKEDKQAGAELSQAQDS